MERLDVPEPSKSTSPMNALLGGGLVQPKNSDLMSRLQSFLPAMAAANENLADAEVIDGDCVKLSNPNEDDTSSSTSTNDNGDTFTSNDTSQRIELTVALGDFNDSAIAKMEDGDTSQHTHHTLTSDANDSPAKSFLKRELGELGKQNDDEPSPKKKPLIEFVD
ncbi:hypothetical protein TrLO_g8949 [Triparma laevis f. longispina]|uniref:Uncharacterized protein n=1 Tax=Triparma laevis f. longispina TaxID=1714387 RepID=A0A9W7FUM7_9STRA|nr:hypothetical protein TrLO_g8949 [Triparma laevis f. longispina]